MKTRKLPAPPTKESGSESVVTKRPGGRRARPDLTAELLIEVALRIADKEGLEALSMRRLASELGVAVMTLYGYFASKEEMLDRIVDSVLENLEFPVVASDDWSVLVRDITRSYRKLLLSHPSIVQLAITRRVVTRAQTRSIEATVGLLRKAGLDGQAAVRGYASLFTYTLGFVAYELARTGQHVQEERQVVEELTGMASKYSFPNVAELATELYRMAHPDTFEYGLDRLLGGLKTEIAGLTCGAV